MHSTTIWHPSKTNNYARYRWAYANEAIDTIIKLAGIGTETQMADIGAGPGNLAKHFLDKVQRVILVEPNQSMRTQAEALYGNHPAFQIVEGSAEATGLPDASVDVIGVGQAVHYFQAEPARREFLRILKPGGWLAVLRNYGIDEDLNAAIQDVYSEENGCDPSIISNRPAWKPMDFYFSAGSFRKHVFPFTDSKNREDYIRSLSTASYAPHEDHPLYPQFVAAAGELFDHYNNNGILHTPAETELYLGQMRV